MKITQSRFLMLYVLFAIIMCVIEFCDIASLRYVVKPLLCVSLFCYVVATCKRYGLKNLCAIKFALIFSFGGDTLLLFPKLFIFGLIAFMLAHLSYIIAFYKDADILSVVRKIALPIGVVSNATFGVSRQNNNNSSTTWLVITLSIIYIILFYSVIENKLNNLKTPVLIYMIVISLMFILAFLRKVKISYNKVTIGALLFVISDSILAVSMFVTQFKFASLLIMLTYMLAQFFIVTGCVDKCFRDRLIK